MKFFGKKKKKDEVDPSSLSIKEIKQILTERGVDFSDCYEKRDLIERLESSGGSRSRSKSPLPSRSKSPLPSRSKSPKPSSSASSDDDLSSLSIKEIKQRLTDLGVDFSDCYEKRDLIERLKQQSTASSSKPKAATEQQQQEDLSSLSIKEIKQRLTDLGVDFSDCYEKRDLIERLQQSSSNSSSKPASRKSGKKHTIDLPKNYLAFVLPSSRRPSTKDMDTLRSHTVDFLQDKMRAASDELSSCSLQLEFVDIEYDSQKPFEKFNLYMVVQARVQSVETRHDLQEQRAEVFEEYISSFTKNYLNKCIRNLPVTSLQDAIEVRARRLGPNTAGGAITLPRFYMALECKKEPRSEPSPKQQSDLVDLCHKEFTKLLQKEYEDEFEKLRLKIDKIELGAGKPEPNYNLYIEFEAVANYHKNVPEEPMDVFRVIAPSSGPLTNRIGSAGGSFKDSKAMTIRHVYVEPIDLVEEEEPEKEGKDGDGDPADGDGGGDDGPPPPEEKPPTVNVEIGFYVALVIETLKEMPKEKKLQKFDDEMEDFFTQHMKKAYPKSFVSLKFYPNPQFQASIPLPRFNLLHQYGVVAEFYHPPPAGDEVFTKFMQCDTSKLYTKIKKLPSPYSKTAEYTLDRALEKQFTNQAYGGKLGLEALQKKREAEEKAKREAEERKRKEEEEEKKRQEEEKKRRKEEEEREKLKALAAEKKRMEEARRRKEEEEEEKKREEEELNAKREEERKRMEEAARKRREEEEEKKREEEELKAKLEEERKRKEAEAARRRREEEEEKKREEEELKAKLEEERKQKEEEARRRRREEEEEKKREEEELKAKLEEERKRKEEEDRRRREEEKKQEEEELKAKLEEERKQKEEEARRRREEEEKKRKEEEKKRKEKEEKAAAEKKRKEEEEAARKAEEKKRQEEEEEEKARAKKKKEQEEKASKEKEASKEKPSDYEDRQGGLERIEGKIEISDLYVAFTMPNCKTEPTPRHYDALVEVTQKFYNRHMKRKYKTMSDLQLAVGKAYFRQDKPSDKYHVYIEWDIQIFFAQKEDDAGPVELLAHLMQIDLMAYLTKVMKIKNTPFTGVCGMYTQQVSSRESFKR